MLYTAAVTVCALLASVGLALAGWGAPAAVAHLAFAVGIVPLIFAATSHFVSVLTRSGQARRGIRLLPAGAQAAGVLAVLAMQGLLPRWALHLAATADFALAAVLLIWIFRRAKACLGKPHPGWRWYPAALGCLLVALLAVPPLLAVPALYWSLRALHLHLNTLGLVGLAALGTLPVLLPTALGKPDPDAAAWLYRRLLPTGGAVLAVALGAAFAWPLAVAGGLALMALAAELFRQWQKRFGLSTLWADGAAASLAAALLGLILLSAAGIVHGAGFITARPSIAAWGAGFLLPLVTGALSQLLPVWRWPGPAIPARKVMRGHLAATGRWRGLLFLSAGILVALGWPVPAGVLAGAAMLLFAFGMARAMGVPAAAG